MTIQLFQYSKILFLLVILTSISCSKDNNEILEDEMEEEEMEETQDEEMPVLEEMLLVGTNKNIISPPEGQGITMSGYSGRTAPFVSIHDNLFVRTLVIEDQDDQTMTIHVSLDMLNIGSDIFIDVYERINIEIPNLNLPLSNLFISATHTHGGPSVHTPAAASYKAERTDKIVQSIIDANNNKVEARMKVGSVSIENINVNRQFPHSNGRCELEVYPEGNSDNEAHFVEFVNDQEVSIASMVTFGVHSTVMGLHNKKITGDLAGYTSRHIENAKENNHVSLFLYTGGGDQSPVVRTQNAPFIDDPQTGPKAFGDRLGSQILAGFESAVVISEVTIKTDTMPVPLQRDFQPKDDQPDGQETRAIYGIKYSDNFAIISSPFELFSSTVQELKANSPFEHTFILSLTNGVAHYIPPSDTYNTSLPYDHDWQCYESRTSIFTSSAEQTFKDQCKQLLIDLNN